MEQLFEFFKALALVTGILFLISILYAIIKAFILELTKKKRQEKAKEELEKAFEQLKNILEEEKPKKETKKTTRTKKNVKED